MIPPDAFAAATREDLMLPVHIALEEAAKSGRADFTLVLEPGTYDNLTIGLDTTVYDRPAMDVHVVGRGPRPAVLHNCQLNIEARDIYLHNLVVTGFARSSYPLQLLTSTAVHAEQVVFLGNHCGDPPPHLGAWCEGRVVSIQGRLRHQSAGAPEPPLSVTFTQCWFLGNVTYGREGTNGFDALIYTERIDHLALNSCLLADNEATAGITTNGPVQLTLEHCLVHETRLRRAWVDVYPNSQHLFQWGLCAIAGRFVWLRMDRDTPPETVRPLVLRDSAVAWKEPPPPRLVVLENSREVPMPALPADLAELAMDTGRPDVTEIMSSCARSGS